MSSPTLLTQAGEQCYAKNVYGICHRLITITVKGEHNNEIAVTYQGRRHLSALRTPDSLKFTTSENTDIVKETEIVSATRLTARRAGTILHEQRSISDLRRYRRRRQIALSQAGIEALCRRYRQDRWKPALLSHRGLNCGPTCVYDYLRTGTNTAAQITHTCSARDNCAFMATWTDKLLPWVDEQ